MRLTDTEFEQLCRQTCVSCGKAHQMQVRDEKGHTLRYRSDTNEWVHDFVKKIPLGTALKAEQIDHRYCLATKLRNERGRS